MLDKWYLINNRVKTGFEGTTMNIAQMQFNEILSSDVADDIIIYNSDLSEETKVETRAIIQGRHPNTQLKSMERYILLPIDSCKAGQYIFYDNHYWLITNFVDNDHMCDKAIMLMCTYLLPFQNDKGKIIKRWVNVVSNAKYNKGQETIDNTFILQSDQLNLTLPCDEETLQLDEPKRLIIGYGKKKKVYKITRPDTVPFTYDYDAGVINIILAQDVFNANTDTDEICDYIDNKSEVLNSGSGLRIVIEGSDEIIAKGESRTYRAKLYNGDTEFSGIANWVLDDDVASYKESSDGSIELSVDSIKHIGKVIKLTAYYNSISSVIDIKVVGAF